MTINDMHHTLNRQLIADLRDALAAPAFIQINSIEPEHELVPVTRGILEGLADALDIADRKITSLEGMTIALAKTLRELIQHFPDATTERAIAILNKVDEALA